MDVPPRRVALAVAAVLGLALVASACVSGGTSTAGGGSGAQGRVGDGTSETPSPTTPAGDGGDGTRSPKPAEVPRVLDFEAPLVGGGTLEGAELAGAPVAVWFWAPW